MKISKDHLVQEIDGISPDDVVITQVEFCNKNIKICYMDYDESLGMMECEHVILNIDNAPSEQKDIIIVNERKENGR